jgi:Fe2+ or Zn2+ uptake regulation protein
MTQWTEHARSELSRAGHRAGGAREELIHGVGERLGYDVGAHDIVLHGACPDCVQDSAR